MTEPVERRRVNVIWEVTQAAVALIVAAADIYSEVRGIDSRRLGEAFLLIIAFYFVRAVSPRSSMRSTDRER